jgi:hypothetical protein
MSDIRKPPGTCECCGYISSWGWGEICRVCYWEGDRVQEDDPDYVGGANVISLREAQENFRVHGTTDPPGLHQGAAAARERYAPDPAWRPVAAARDLSSSPAEAREAFERLCSADRWYFVGESRGWTDTGAAAAIVTERLAQEGWQVLDQTRGDANIVRTLSCSVDDVQFEVSIFGTPHLALSVYITRRILAALGPERWGECFLQISERLNLDIARSSPSLTIVSDLDEAEVEGPVAFVDWIQYWSPSKVARWGLETLTRGPFARVDACDNGGAAVWLVRDPLIEPMSRATAAAFLGLTLRNTLRKDDTTGEWLSIPWP